MAPSTTKRQIEAGPEGIEDEDEDPEAKRRRVLEETRDIDADSDGSGSESSEDERSEARASRILRSGLILDSDEEDETAELLRELEKIKKERAEQREKEVLMLILDAMPAGLVADHPIPGTSEGSRGARKEGA